MSEPEVQLKPNPDNLWVCPLCYPGFEHVAWLGEETPFCLIKREDKFHFVGSSDQGHDGCIWITFEVDPFPDPDPKADNDEVGCIWEWGDHVMRPFGDLDLSIVYGYECYDACLKAGYDPGNDEHGHVYYWLAKWAGQAVADFKSKVTP